MIIKIEKATGERVIYWLAYFIFMIICTMIIPLQNRNDFIVYICVFTIGLTLVIVSDLIYNKKLSFFLLFISLLIIGCFMAFRDQTAIDDWQYQRKFLALAGKSFSQAFIEGENEKGFVILDYFLYKITNGNYDIAQAITVYFSFFIWAVAIFKNKKKCNLPFMVFFLITHYYCLIMGAGLIRMFIAIPIVFLSLNSLWEKNAKKFLFIILIASFFHVSALVLLLLIPFSLKKYNFSAHWKAYLMILCVIIPFLFQIISKFAIQLFGQRYEGYSVIGTLYVSIGDFDILPIWGICLYYYIKSEKEENERFKIYLVLLSLTMIFSIVSSMVSLGRVVYYTNLGILLFASELMQKKGKQSLDILLCLVLMAYGVFYMMYSGFMNVSVVTNMFPIKLFL